MKTIREPGQQVNVRSDPFGHFVARALTTMLHRFIYSKFTYELWFDVDG